MEAVRENKHEFVREDPNFDRKLGVVCAGRAYQFSGTDNGSDVVVRGLERKTFRK